MIVQVGGRLHSKYTYLFIYIYYYNLFSVFTLKIHWSIKPNLIHYIYIYNHTELLFEIFKPPKFDNNYLEFSVFFFFNRNIRVIIFENSVYTNKLQKWIYLWKQFTVYNIIFVFGNTVWFVKPFRYYKHIINYFLMLYGPYYLLYTLRHYMSYTVHVQSQWY